jgi:hypothetical protein
MRYRAALLALCAAGAARADEGNIVFARFNAIWQQPASGAAAPAKIADLPDDATEVRFLETTRDGRLLVLDMGAYPIWISASAPDRPAHVEGGSVCRGRARPAPGGDAVVCPSAQGLFLIAAGGAGVRDELRLAARLDEPQFRGPSGTDLAGLGDEGVVGIDRRQPAERRVLASPGPRAHLLVAPNGERAVAVFGESDAGRIRSFFLDGQGRSRQLGGPGVPVLWSWDSTWVLFQEGDIKNAPAPGGGGDEGAYEAPAAPDPWLLGAPRKTAARKKGKRAPAPPPPPTTRACVARATGGEVKCWDNFTGMAFSPDSTHVLLKRGHALFIGKLNGVRPDPPTQLIDGVDGAATWTPGPAAAPQPPGPPKNDFSL